MCKTFDSLALDSVEVAKAIRYSGNQYGYKLNMTQINKLLYIIYGAWLVQKKQFLTTEKPSAWPYGPVFPKVHKNIKLYDAVTKDDYEKIKKINSDITTLIDEVVSKFGNLTAGQLSEWSHEENSPWYSAVHSSKGKWNTKLNDEDIYNYFYSYF